MDPKCVLCLASTGKWILCQACEKALPWCEEGRSPRALFAYRPPVEEFIVALKFHEGLHFANWFGQKMIERWGVPEVDCIVPLPLHPIRQRERGFNQTLEIAKIVASETGVYLDRWSCRRIKHRPAQSQLKAKWRSSNVSSKMFSVSPALRGKKVLVIEDVITTGTTIRAFIGALEKAGVKEVMVWACCQA